MGDRAARSRRRDRGGRAAVRDRLRLLADRARRCSSCSSGRRRPSGCCDPRAGGQPAHARDGAPPPAARCCARAGVLLAWSIPGRWSASPCCARSTRSAAGRALGGVVLRDARRAAAQRADGSRGRGAPLAGFAAGALTTSTTTAGPPLLIYLLGRGHAPGQLRDTLHASASSGSTRSARSRCSPPARTARFPTLALLAILVPASAVGPARRAAAVRPRSRTAAATSRSLTAVLLVSVVVGPRDGVSPDSHDLASAGRLARLTGEEAHGAGTRRSADRGGRVLPGPGRAELAHAHRGGDALRGPAAGLRRLRRPHPRPAAPRPALPAEARGPAAGDRPPAVGRRPELQPRVPRAPHRAARAGHARSSCARWPRAIHSQQLDRSKPLWEMWLVAGARGRPLRADLQDPPRARRRHRRRRPRDGALRPRAGAARPSRTRASRGRPSASRAPRRARRAAASRASCAAAVRAGRPARVGAATRPDGVAATAAREAVEGVGEIAWARPEPRARDAAQRADRPAPPVRVRALRARRTSSSSRTRSAARSTTSCSPSSPARCARWLQLARRAHRGPRAARARARLDPRRRRAAATLGNRLAVDARPAAGLHRGPGRAPAGRQAQAMDGLKESKQAVGAEVLAERAELRAADDPRAGLAAELLHAAVQPDRDQRARARSSRSTCSGASCRTLFPVAFLPKRPRARGRDHVLQRRGSTSACSATTTRCRTSTTSPASASPDELVAASAARRASRGKRGRAREPAAPRRGAATATTRARAPPQPPAGHPGSDVGAGRARGCRPGRRRRV